MDGVSTSYLPDGFVNICSNSTDVQRKHMLVYLQNMISVDSKKVFPKNVIYSDYVDHIKDFVSDSVLRESIIAEVTTLGLFLKIP